MRLHFLKTIFYNCIKILAFCLKKTQSVFIIPEETGVHEPYSITNYTGDNVLAFLYYLINNHDSPDLFCKQIYIVALNSMIESECKRLQSKLKYIKLIPIAYPQKKKKNFIQYFIYHFCMGRCRIIINPSDVEPLHVKARWQLSICLNYFSAPFKSDILKHRMAVQHQTIDYVIAASDFSVRMDLCASNLSYFNYSVLGFIRQDILLNPRFKRVDIESWLGITPMNRIIVYAPTHRDGKLHKQHSAIIGCENLKLLNTILSRCSTILLIKPHSGMLDDQFLGLDDCSNIMIYEPSPRYTFYDILPHADLLITDYSSIYFDFLVTGKPVVFNFCDRVEYEKNRGLSYNPVELFCAGKIVYTEEELYTVIEDELNGKTYKNDKHYNDVRRLFIKYEDGKTCERVYDFICEKIAE